MNGIAEGKDGPDKRRVWVIADQHIGWAADGKDGADWLRDAVADTVRNVGMPDYVINLGDMSARSREEELRAYAELRASSGIKDWFELVGNHDFKSLARGWYEKWVRRPKYWTITDGSMVFLSLPQERSNAAGLFVPEVSAWLRAAVAANAGRNIVICAHSFPYDTVEFSCRPARCLYPKPDVESFLNDVRVDLWLGGHIHFSRRAASWSVKKGRTTFLNAGSITHAYGTGASRSFFLEFERGSRRAVARCRNHDRREFEPEFDVAVELPHDCEPGDRHVFEPVGLSVSPRYAEIEQEEVDHV